MNNVVLISRLGDSLHPLRCIL